MSYASSESYYKMALASLQSESKSSFSVGCESSTIGSPSVSNIESFSEEDLLLSPSSSASSKSSSCSFLSSCPDSLRPSIGSCSSYASKIGSGTWFPSENSGPAVFYKTCILLIPFLLVLSIHGGRFRPSGFPNRKRSLIEGNGASL